MKCVAQWGTSHRNECTTPIFSHLFFLETFVTSSDSVLSVCVAKSGLTSAFVFMLALIAVGRRPQAVPAIARLALSRILWPACSARSEAGFSATARWLG